MTYGPSSHPLPASGARVDAASPVELQTLNLVEKLGVALRVMQTVEPLSRRIGEAQHHQLARWRRQSMLRRFAMHVCAIGVGDDQSSLGRKYLAGQILREAEEQPTPMGAVVLPFRVAARI